jgi:drug/metabolite transporter (DMT)-like permease
MGIIYSLFLLSGVSAIALGTPITIVTSLIYTQPLFTAVISQLTGKEKVAKAKLGVILIGVLGTFLVTGLQIMNLQVGLGIILPVFGGFCYAWYLWLKRQATSKIEYNPYQLLFYTFLFALPSIVVVWMIMRSFKASPVLVGIIVPNTLQLGLLLLFAGFCTVLPYSLLNYVKAEEISPTSEGLLLLGDPLLHTL